MISKKLDNFFHDNLWMINEREYMWFQDKNNKVVPTPVLNGKISHSDYVKRCEEFLDKAEKALDKQALHELATMFKTADIDLGSEDVNTRWQNYLTLTEVFQYPNGEYNADAFDKEIIQSRNPVDPQPEFTDKLDNRSGKEYTGPDAVYMIVGQIKIPASSRPADTYYYSTIKNNWVKNALDGTQYDSKADAEEDLWDAENLFIDDYSGETRFGWKYQLAVKIVGRKPRKGDHKNLTMTESKDVLTYYTERNKAFDKLPGVAGMGYYVIGEAPGFIDLYMINEDSGTRYDDDGVEFGFKSLEDAAKYVNVVTGRNGYKIGKFKNTLNLRDHDDIHFIQLNVDAMEHLKKLIEEPTVEILPYSTDDFVLKGSDAVVSQLQKKYKLLSSPSSEERLDRHDLVKYKDDDQSQGLEGKVLPKESQSGEHTVGYSYKDLMKLGHAARRDNYQNRYNNQDYWENDMSIYEQLNKINDSESLSEKYNVKNAEELKKLKESSEADSLSEFKDMKKYQKKVISAVSAES